MVKGDPWYGILVYPGVVLMKHVDNEGFEHWNSMKEDRVYVYTVYIYTYNLIA